MDNSNNLNMQVNQGSHQMNNELSSLTILPVYRILLGSHSFIEYTELFTDASESRSYHSSRCTIANTAATTNQSVLRMSPSHSLMKCRCLII